MGVTIKIKAGSIEMNAELNDGPTSQEILSKLPVQGSVNRWGEEIYFDIPVHQQLEPGARAEMEIGELGYWPTGNAFCIFFGPTPASSGDKPVAASAVTILGKVIGDATAFTAVKDGERIDLERD